MKDGTPEVKLPNVEAAVISEPKVADYLLSSTHPQGRGKAAFFLGLGFRAEDWKCLEQALVGHTRDNDVMRTESFALRDAFRRGRAIAGAGRKTAYGQDRVVRGHRGSLSTSGHGLSLALSHAFGIVWIQMTWTKRGKAR